ncbi:MAG: ribosome assembly RNA-binding protein YhbY [SAR324 cluster bacterium]|nr:ribosome assembly RNA-binding protein YhbY [SAR324 cluster bacterium]MBL7035058.1 ribosome assembly RNA-binding protein YhbY [SAR324 cluster bacterium]
MTGKQKRYLRALAHPLKPLVNLGKQGLSSESRREIETQLLDHELIKLKILDSCPLSKKECANELSRVEGLEVVQVIGKTLVLYSPHPEEPEIKLPAVTAS